MSDAALLLRVLQNGDSFFPSGGVSFSWGLEMLCADGAVASERDMEAFLIAHLHHRWAQFDRPVLVAAAAAAEALTTVAHIDRLVDAQTLAAEQREGSRRNGSALLAMHVKLETPGSRDYLTLVRQGEANGHLAPMQGLLWSRRGIPAREAVILSAHATCTGVLGAAVRLGVIGHLGAQRILTKAHIDIAVLAQTRPPDLDEINAFMPQTEIASMRHETAEARLFAN